MVFFMEKIIYQGNYISVSEQSIDGHIYERASLRPGVHVVPIKDDKVLFMKEYRTHEGIVRFKLVSGWCDKEGKTALDHAQEELAEELGMEAETWEEFHCSNAPGATVNPNTTYFICRNLKTLEHKPENPDTGCRVLEHEWMDVEAIYACLNNKTMWIDDSALVALLALYNIKNQA